jgi:hypothetical protein
MGFFLLLRNKLVRILCVSSHSHLNPLLPHNTNGAGGQ